MNIELSFDTLGLTEVTLESIRSMEYTKPSPIQAECIPLILQNKDIIGQAQTGTGKTAAYAIPIVERAHHTPAGVQFLVVCPTRELVTQVEKVIRQLAKGRPHVRTVAILGGHSYDRQNEQLRRNPQIVVGTPGRILDHIRRRTLDLNPCEMVVIDEADEMLDRGFLDESDLIMQAVGEHRQTVLFSATMPPRIIELTEKYQQNPVHVNISPTQVLGTTISQGYYAITESSKTPLLHLLLKAHTPKLTLVFCKTKAKTGEVTSMLQQVGVVAEALHGDISQQQRNDALRRFRSGIVNVLVATDVAARGLDIENVELVVNYDVPMQPEHYVHRIGRTGRAGRLGRAISFITGREYRRLREIETYTKTFIERLELPSFDDIKKARFDELVAGLVEKSIAPLDPEVEAVIRDLTDRGVSVAHIAGVLLASQRDAAHADLNPVGPIQFDQVPWGGRSEGGQGRPQGRYAGNAGGYRQGGGGGGYAGNAANRNARFHRPGQSHSFNRPGARKPAPQG